MEHFADRLTTAVRLRGNPVLVGLDPRLDALPEACRPQDASDPQQIANAYGSFCRDVIDVVAPLVPAVKPQAAFFEELGPAGMVALAETVAYASRRGLIVILDAKRGDIGSTAAAYARGLLGSGGQSPWGADAVTVNPYLGEESLSPFVEVAVRRGAGLFVLVKTSNPGSSMLQDLPVSGQKLYQHVAAWVEQQACQTRGRCGYGCVGAVVGATYPEQLAALRGTMPHALLLVPGYGAQGATARDVAGAFDRLGEGAIINSSRAIIFAYSRPQYAAWYGALRWQAAVEAATRDMIDRLKAETPAGRLG